MVSSTTLLPEEVLIAVLHRVGRDIRIVDDDRLAKIFDDAAVRSKTFRTFERHPQYRYSERLSSVLQMLDLGGSVVRANAPAHYFHISDHTSGRFGESLFAQLSETDRILAVEIADRIRSTFSRD